MEISEKELRTLRRDSAKLAALEAGGVDNWEWYSDSLVDFHKEEALEEFVDNMVDSFHETIIDAEVDYPAGHEAGPSIRVSDKVAEDFIRLVIEGHKELE